MAMLCILRLCQRDSVLMAICKDSGMTLEDLQRSSELMVEWLEGMSSVDAIADWSMKILEPLL